MKKLPPSTARKEIFSEKSGQLVQLQSHAALLPGSVVLVQETLVDSLIDGLDGGLVSDGGDALTVMDQVRDTKNTEDGWMEHITLQNAFRALNDREKQILSLRFYDGKTQMEVASALGISQAQVSRLEKGAIGAMRKSVSVS